MDDEVYVTKHGGKRSRERLGIPKRAVERAAEKALEHGLTHAETCGGLRKYLDWLFFKAGGQPRNFRVYGDKVFIFQDKRLITVLNVPPEHRKQAARLQHKKVRE